MLHFVFLAVLILFLNYEKEGYQDWNTDIGR